MEVCRATCWWITMDGNMDVGSQVRLMRTVIGRKYMEIDDLIERSEGAAPEDVQLFEDLIEFLKNDIRGYKAIIEDLKDGSADLTADLYDIASLPERAVGIYNDFYLPSLGENDLADEQKAMEYKSQYAREMVLGKFAKVGRAALDNPLVLSLMARNDEFVALVGKYVLSEPELLNALNDE